MPVSKTEIVFSAMTGNSINCYDRSRVTFMTGIARKHMVHMKKELPQSGILLYKADTFANICSIQYFT
jgi:hypothetical protein